MQNSLSYSLFLLDWWQRLKVPCFHFSCQNSLSLDYLAFSVHRFRLNLESNRHNVYNTPLYFLNYLHYVTYRYTKRTCYLHIKSQDQWLRDKDPDFILDRIDVGNGLYIQFCSFISNGLYVQVFVLLLLSFVGLAFIMWRPAYFANSPTHSLFLRQYL